jgi:rubrerythrin
MTDIDVLRLALGKEEEAIKIYQDMQIGHPQLKELLAMLVIEEQKHRKLIEQKIFEFTR